MNLQALTSTVENNTSLMQYISESLIDSGFRPNLKGFTYIKEAIYIHHVIISTNKAFRDIYAAIAESYGISVGSVERAIKSSIESAWNTDKLNKLHNIFASFCINKEKPPSNSQFIAVMAETIRLDFKKNNSSIYNYSFKAIP